MVNRKELQELVGYNICLEMKLKNGIPIHHVGLLDKINQKYILVENSKNRGSEFKIPIKQIISVEEYDEK